MKPKFLVIDDDPDICSLMTSMLSSLECEVVIAESGEEALEIVKDPQQAQQIDLIFLDLMMPGLSGFAVIELLKRGEHTRNIPVIMLTAMDTGDDMITGYKHGADYYITKPFTLDQLLYGLDLVLGQTEGKKVKIHTI